MTGLWFAPPIVGRRLHLVAASMVLQAIVAGVLVGTDLALSSAYGGLTVGSNRLLLAVAVALVAGTAVVALTLGAGRPGAYRHAVRIELAWLATSVLMIASGSLAAPGLLVLSLALLGSLSGPGVRRELRLLRDADPGLIAGRPRAVGASGPWVPRRSRRVLR